ncbi:MAG: hypothetical protein P8Y80_09870 [Acidobacteriota bacterium]
MDLNQARILIAQMQACFKEIGVPFVNESEILNQANCTDTIMFRSWQSKNDHLAEIVTSLFIEPNVVEVSINYREEIDRLNESDLEKLFHLLNAFNNWDAAFYWLLLPRDNKLKFRWANLLPARHFSDNQFKSVLKRFLNQGPQHYSYIRRLIYNNEDPDRLFSKMQAEY